VGARRPCDGCSEPAGTLDRTPPGDAPSGAGKCGAAFLRVLPSVVDENSQEPQPGAVLPTGSFDLICPREQPCVQRVNSVRRELVRFEGGAREPTHRAQRLNEHRRGRTPDRDWPPSAAARRWRSGHLQAHRARRCSHEPRPGRTEHIACSPPRRRDAEPDRSRAGPVGTPASPPSSTVLALPAPGSVTARRANEAPSRSTVTSSPSARRAATTAAWAVGKFEAAAMVVNRSTSLETRSTNPCACTAYHPPGRSRTPPQPPTRPEPVAGETDPSRLRPPWADSGSGTPTASGPCAAATAGATPWPESDHGRRHAGPPRASTPGSLVRT
jgi:hypothetical protein